MLSSTDSVVQKQLSTALGVISETDFPEKWPTLLPVRIDLNEKKNARFSFRADIYWRIFSFFCVCMFV